MPENNVNHTKWMKRAIFLASLGKNTTSPNPRVGAVILDKNGNLISEGFHYKTDLKVESGRKQWLLDDKTLLNEELANDGRQAAAEFDLDELVINLDKNRPLRLSLSGVFSELPVPPFVVKEWRSLS